PAHITFREYYRHFEAFLPPDVLAGERAVVLIDNLQTGASVEHLARILEAYYADRGVAGTVIRSGFHQAGAPFGFVSLPAARYEVAGDMPRDATLGRPVRTRFPDLVASTALATRLPRDQRPTREREWGIARRLRPAGSAASTRSRRPPRSLAEEHLVRAYPAL